MLPGQIGPSNAGPVIEKMLAVINRGAAVLIADMTATRSCDHAGADALARVYECAAANGAELRLVVPAPVVRRVIALCGLGHFVPVFFTLEAAQAGQARASVLPLPTRAQTGSARPAPPPGSRPVTDLPVAGSASPDGFGHAAPHGIRRHEFQDRLAQAANGIFHAGLVLQAALDQPADTLRQAAERALDLLDGVVCETRTAAFADGPHAVDGLADAGKTGDAVGLRPQAWSGFWSPADDAARQRQRIATPARQSREQSWKAQLQTLQVAVSSAATESRVAATFSQLAASNPHHSPHLRTLSQAAAGHAARLCQWADERSRHYQDWAAGVEQEGS